MGHKAAARDDSPAMAGITVIHVDGMDMMNSLEQANARAATPEARRLRYGTETAGSSSMKRRAARIQPRA
jgi:hypothetical protein